MMRFCRPLSDRQYADEFRVGRLLKIVRVHGLRVRQVRFLPALRRAQEHKARARRNQLRRNCERENVQTGLPRDPGQRDLLHGQGGSPSSVMYYSRPRRLLGLLLSPAVP